MESTLRRTWAEIDLDALAHNYRTLRDRVGPEVKFLGVVKADAYGHGAVQVSRTLQRHHHAYPDPGPHAPRAGGTAHRPAHYPGGILPG